MVLKSKNNKVALKVENWLNNKELKECKQIVLIPTISIWWTSDRKTICISLILFFIDIQLWFGEVEELVKKE